MEFVLDEKLLLLTIKAYFELYHVLVLRTLPKIIILSATKMPVKKYQKPAETAY